MEVEHQFGSHSPLLRGRGRARGRARAREPDGGDAPRPGLDSNSNKIQPGVDTSHAGQMAATHHSSHPQQEDVWSDAQQSPAENDNTAEENITHNRPPQRSRKYKFDNSIMSLINRQLGQARGDRSSPMSNQTRSQDRLNHISRGDRSVSHKTLTPQDLRLKLSRHGSTDTNGSGSGDETVHGDTDRPRSGTFPLAADSPVSHHAVSDGPPPDPPYRGMHDNRTEFRHHGHDKGRGRGRARGRARHTDTVDHAQSQRPGSSSPQLHHPHAPSKVMDQFADAGVSQMGEGSEVCALENDFEMLTVTVSTNSGGVRFTSVNPHSPRAPSSRQSGGHSTHQTGGHSGTKWVKAGGDPQVRGSRSGKSPSQGSGSGTDDSGVSSPPSKSLSVDIASSDHAASSQNSPGSRSGSTEHTPQNKEGSKESEENIGQAENNRSPSPHGISSAHKDEHSARMSPLTLQIPDRPSPSVPQPQTVDAAKPEDENDAQSPDFLKTPPGYQKVLDWAAEVCSPTSPIDMPKWN